DSGRKHQRGATEGQGQALAHDVEISSFWFEAQDPSREKHERAADNSRQQRRRDGHQFPGARGGCGEGGGEGGGDREGEGEVRRAPEPPPVSAEAGADAPDLASTPRTCSRT